MFFSSLVNMSENMNAILKRIKCEERDELGYNLSFMYQILFGISCITVPLGILVNIIFIIGIICRAKKVFNMNSYALLLSCLCQVLLSIVQGPIRVYFYYNHGCLPVAGSPLCQLTVYLDYIPTQINNFLVAQMSIARNQRRILLSVNLFLIWFGVTWSPWVLYDFFQTVLNLRYSVYIDAITTFIVYLNYTFSSGIVLITMKELRHFYLEKLGLRRGIPAFHQRVGPSKTVRYVTEGNQIAIISKYK